MTRARRPGGVVYEMTDTLTKDKAKGSNPSQVVQRLYQIETARIVGPIVSGETHSVVITGDRKIGTVEILIRGAVQ